MLHGALIGFGQVAEKAHAPAWKETKNFQIVAVVDERPERVRLAAEHFPGIRSYQTIAELLTKESGLDFVDIATPPHLHYEQTLLALRHHCHVLCEKPLVLAVEHMRELRTRAQAENRTVFCGHNWKYAPIFQQAFRLIRSGAVGSVRHAELHTLRQAPAADAASASWRTDPQRAGGGILVDHGWHNFYLLKNLIDEEPRAVSARLTLPPSGGAEQEATCLIEFPDASAFLYLSWRAPYRSNWGVVYGTAGTMELQDDHIVLRRNESDPQRFEFPKKLSEGSAHPDWFQSMLEDFRAEIQYPDQRLYNLREAETCLSLLAHAYQSHRLGGNAVSLPSDQNLVHA